MKPIVGILAFALLLAACEGAPGPAPLELTGVDSGRTVAVQPGQRVRITLESNASTGYRWRLTVPDSVVLKLVSREYVEPETSTTVVGAPGSEIWQFEAAARGVTSLELSYLRPFEPEQAAGSFTLNVEVE